MNQPTSTSYSARTAANEHVNLRQLLAQVVAAFGRPSPHPASGPDVVAARLDTLRGPLRAHFDEEERSGLFERIEESAPEQSASCDRLRREHRRLLQRLDDLRSASEVERRGPAWGREVRALVEDLGRHEAHEAEVLAVTKEATAAAPED
jgi:hypothetical protein